MHINPKSKFLAFMHNIVPQLTRAGLTALALVLVLIGAAVVLTFATSNSQAQSLGGANWKQIGPAPLIIDPANGPDSGTVVDIAIDPTGNSDQTIYIAGNGGIWKTTDSGNNWLPKTDSLPTLSFGAVALDPGNPSIVYAGTGNLFTGQSGAPYQVSITRGGNGFFGIGVYKSTDGGGQWDSLPSNIIPRGKGITRIVLPESGTLLVATNAGLYRVTGGGVSMVQIPVGGLLGRFITDLRLDTANSSTVYAAVQGSGIFVSTDKGQTFNASSNLFTLNNGAPTNIGNIFFAQSTLPDNQTIYANVGFASGSGAGIFKSTNTGSSWTQITTATAGDIESVAAGYSLTVGVDPQDAQRVYIGARSLYSDTNGFAAGVNASNRKDLNLVHADQHALVFSPASHFAGLIPTRVYNGTDGGIATTADQGTTWNLINNGIATMLFYQIDIGRGSTENNKYTYGAAQDQGVSSHRPESVGTSWLLGKGGDGYTVAVDPNNPIIALGFASAGSYYFRSSADGKSWPSAGNGSAFSPPPAVLSALAFDPNGSWVYALGDQLYQSSNNGASFTGIRNVAPSNVTAMAMKKADSNTIWIGLANGTVQRTSNARAGTNSSWTLLTVQNSPAPYVSGIAIDPTNTNTAVAVYPSTGSSKRVFLTTDNGANWSDISENLPSTAAANAVVIDSNTTPHTIIVATDDGVLKTADGGATWTAVGGGLPNVQCTSLAIDSSAIPSLLRVGTYGRSAFELDYDRLYVDRQAPLAGQDGTREHPFRTVRQALNNQATGGTRYINILGGDYTESQNNVNNVTINQACTLNAINGPVTIH